jgi:putative transposase
MNVQMTAQLVADPVVTALWIRGEPKQLLNHSEQGSQ